MVDWLIKVWRKIQPYWQRVAHAETVVSVWEFIRPFITSPYFWSGIVAVLVIIWSIATSEFGPYAFVAALIGSGGVFWLRNQFKYRSQFLELKQLVTKPPEIQVETQYRDPSGWALMSKVRDRNLAGLVHLLQCQGDWQALPQYKSTPPQVFLFCNYRNKSIYNFSVSAVRGNVRVTDITSEGLVKKTITIEEVKVLTAFVPAQSDFELYISVEIAYETTLNDVKALIDRAENPEWEIHRLAIKLSPSDEGDTIPELELPFGEFYKVPAKQKSNSG